MVITLIMILREGLRKRRFKWNAVADVTVEVIHTVLFALASVITSFFIIATIDWRVGMIVAFWVFGFYLLMRFNKFSAS